MKHYSRGFTLVETLVATAILMIAIAGPLVIASKGLRAALYARDQMTGTFLAQESMEIIKNMRDNNVRIGDATNWLDGFNYPLQCNSASSSCDASAIDSPAITTCGTGCQIYLGSEGYSHIASGPSALFKRMFYFSRPAGYPDSEVRVNVVVSWNEGTIPYEVDLSSDLVATAR